MLYLVATPIGNLKDISLRALEVLKAADEIACEDTRRSATLLNHYGIKKPLVSYHKFNERASGEKIVEKLKAGKNIALITDAGMPVISDPGATLVRMLMDEGLEYTVIPGACAFVSALALSGLEGTKFCFLGFLPDKIGEKKALLQKYASLDMTIVFYSAPHDADKDIACCYSVFGERNAVAVKEISKLHESAVRFKLSEGIEGEKRGEYVILIDKPEKVSELNSLTEKEHIKYYLDMGYDKKEALKAAAKDRGVSKSDLYKFSLDL